MSLSGRLEDLQLRDLLQILNLSCNSGCLQLNSGESQAELLFNEGLVVSALQAGAGTNQNAPMPSHGEGMALRRLSTISLVRELMYWDVGDFSFKAAQIAESIHHTAQQEHACLDQGLSLDELLHEETIALPVSGNAAKEAPAQQPPQKNIDSPIADSDDEIPDVLLVDDDPEIAANLVQALAGKGLKARSFNCGKALLDAARSAWNDDESPLLLIDLIMPRFHGGGILGGLELAEQIRSSHAGCLCLVYSDYPCPEVEQRLQQLEATEFFTKPLSRIAGCDDNFTEISDFCDAVAKQSAALLGVSPPVPEKHSTEETTSAPSSVASSAKSESEEDFHSAGMGVLKGMLQELQTVESGEQVMLLVLRFASEVLGRAVLFSVGNDHIVGLGQFGYGNAELPADEKVREIRLPVAERSSFAEILNRPVVRYGVLGEGHWDAYLRRELGLGSSSEVFIGPVISDGRVLAILCGDNNDTKQGKDDGYALEIFLQQAGIILENLKIRGQLHGLSGLLGKTFEC